MTETLSYGARAVLADLKTTGLLCKNVRIHDKRTSIRLEPEMWRSLSDIAVRERCSIHDLCSAVEDVRDCDSSFTAALRVFIMMYYRDVPQQRTTTGNKQSRQSSIRAAVW